MNLVKKTPVRLQWRLSTSLSYRRRRDRGGEIREEEEEEEARERGLTVEGEKCFPSASLFFFLSFAHPFSSSGWCLLSKLSSNSGQKRTEEERQRNAVGFH